MNEIESLDDSFLEVETTEVAETEETVTETEETTEVAETTEVEETEDSTTESKEETEKEPEKEPKQEWTFSQAMDEREKRQKFERENEELKKQLAEREKSEDVSVFDDEDRFKDQERSRTEELVRNNTLNMSQAFAEEVFGEDKVNEAVEWMKTEGVKSAYVVDQFNTAKLPFHKIVRMYEDEQARQNPDALKAKLRAEILEELKSESESEEKQKSIKPSLASKRSSGTEQTPVTERFEDMLGD